MSNDSEKQRREEEFIAGMTSLSALSGIDITNGEIKVPFPKDSALVNAVRARSKRRAEEEGREFREVLIEEIDAANAEGEI